LFQGQQCNSIGAVKLTAVRFFSIGYSYEPQLTVSKKYFTNTFLWTSSLKSGII
jgi:hypothetical protein